MPEIRQGTKIMNNPTQPYLYPSETINSIEIKLNDGYIFESAEPMSVEQYTRSAMEYRPLCHSCGRTVGSPYLVLGNGAYHLDVDECIQNTRYIRSFDVKEYMSNKTASTFKTIDIRGF